MFGLKRKVSGATKNITKVETEYSFLFGYHDNLLYSSHSVAKCLIIEGTKAKQFGRHIKRVEKEWLIEEINNFLDKLINF